MDPLCGCNQVGGPALSGFSPAAPAPDPRPGLAADRLGGPQPGSPTLPDQSGLLHQSLQMQSVMLQMMGLLLGLMANQLSGQQGQTSSSTSPISGVGGAGSAANTTSGPNGPAPANDTKDQNEIKSYIAEAAAAYGTDPKVLTEIARRESNFQAGAVNDWDSNAKKGTPSKGMFQFIEPTFKSYATSAKKANPKAWEGLGELNWLDWRQQALATSWAIKNGHGSAWATYKAAGGT